MTLFRRTNEQRSISYQDVWGRGADSDMFGGGERRALRLVPVFAATRLLGDSVASLPLQAYRKVGDTRRSIPTPPLFVNPSPYCTIYDWVFRVVASIVLRGNAFGLITARDSLGFATQIEWIHPDDVSLNQDRVGVPIHWYVWGREVDPADLVHIPGYVLPGKILGLSPIKAYALTVDTGLLSQSFGRDWFAMGKTPSAVLSSDQTLSDEMAERMKRRFMASSKDREPIVLGAGLAYKPIMVPPEESQFLATMKATTNQIASIYGIPPEMIGGDSGSSMTYANVEQQAINFVTYTLRPYVTKLEGAFSALMSRPTFVRFNVDAMIRADLKTRYEAHHLSLTDGWKNRDEIRTIEDMPPLPDGKGQQFAPIPAPSAIGGGTS